MSQSERLSGLAALAAGQYTRIALGLISAPVLARSLGAEGRGIWALIASFDLATSLILALGLPQAFAFWYREATDEAGKVEAMALANGGIRRIAAISVTVAAVVFVVLYQRLGVPMAISLALLVLSTPSTTFNLVSRQLAGLEHSDLRFSIIDGAPAVFLAAAILLLGALGSLSLGTGLAALVLSRLLAFVPGLLVWRRGAGRSSDRRFFLHGVRAAPATLAQMAQGRIEQLAIWPLGLESVGRYAIAGLFGAVLNPLYASIATRVFRARSSASRSTTARDFLLVSTMAIIVASCAIFIVGPVFGDDFAEARMPAAVLALGSISFGAFLVTRALLDREGRPGITSVLQLLHLALIAAVVPFVASRSGLLAATVAVVLLQVVRMCAMGLALRWHRRTRAGFKQT